MLIFDYIQGEALPSTQALNIKCVDCETRLVQLDPIDVTVVDSASWLLLNPTTGTTPYIVMVSVNPSGLIPGIYNATIGIQFTSKPICNPEEVETIVLVVKAKIKHGKGRNR